MISRRSDGRLAAAFGRAALGIIYVWFGALKMAGVSPAAELVERAIPILPGSLSVPLLGAAEVAIGFGFVLNRTSRWAAWVAMAHLGVASVIVLAMAGIQGAFPALSMEGQYVIKNLALIAVCWMLTLRGTSPSTVAEESDPRNALEVVQR